MSCKHRFALMEGDTEKLVSDNASDLGKLQTLISGSDVEPVFRMLSASLKAAEELKKRLAIEIKRRDISLTLKDAKKYLLHDGFLRGGISKFLLDVFDEAGQYVGTAPIAMNVFAIDLPNLLELDNISTYFRRIGTEDHLYFFLSNSSFAVMTIVESKLPEFRTRLRVLMTT